MLIIDDFKMQEIVIIVAGGSGSRMKSELPKQFIEVNGLPILMHTINRFCAYSKHIEIRLVLPTSQFSYWKKLVEKHNFNSAYKLFPGGKTRFHSVKNGLENIKENSLVAIHDGVRPFVSNTTIEQGFETAKNYGAGIPVVEVFETIRKIEKNLSVTVNRENYKLVQTPQVFQSEILLNAYKQNYTPEFTDDASVVEAMKKPVSLFEGNRENIKITTPNDLLVAECYAANKL